MGGPCLVRQRNATGKVVATKQGPPCTDNFQIIEFMYEGLTYYSAEQCFQSLKFKANSTMRQKIQQAKPQENESDGRYGMRVWQLGQSRSSPLRNNYEGQKLKIMFMINLAKYACHESLQQELVKETGDFEIVGAHSTWEWTKWNGLIQMLIRKHIQQNEDLKQLLGHYKEMSSKQLEDVLEGKEIEKEEADDVKENDMDNEYQNENGNGQLGAIEEVAEVNDKNENGNDVAAVPASNENNGMDKE